MKFTLYPSFRGISSSAGVIHRMLVSGLSILHVGLSLQKTFLVAWAVFYGVQLKKIVRLISILILLGVLILPLVSKPVLCWSNGSYSSDPSNPGYGTHDWIAQHALDWLPAGEKQYLVDNLAGYLYGTELPDNKNAVDGIGDNTKHHVYFFANGSLQDGVSAARASDEYQIALSFLKAKDYANASKTAGIMSHYIVDVAVFGHVMGASSSWGVEKHHDDYEAYVNARTASYSSSFTSCLHFDGVLEVVSAYDATKNLAYDTTFDGGGGLTCVWMDNNYNWSNAVFLGRAGESLNLAVNYLADVLHSLYVAASQSASPTPTVSVPELSSSVLVVALVVFVVVVVVFRRVRLSGFWRV